MAIIPTGYAQANLFFVGAGVPRNAQLAIGLQNTVPGTPLALAGVVADAFTAVDGPLTQMSETVTLEKIKVKLGPNATGAEATLAVGTAGGQALEPLPPNVSVLVNKLNATGGKKNAGKIFWVGVPEAATDGGGLLTPTWLGDLQDAMDIFLGALSGEDAPMVILHNDSTTPTEVTSLSVQQRLATQKRRLRRAGGRRAVTP